MPLIATFAVLAFAGQALNVMLAIQIEQHTSAFTSIIAFFVGMLVVIWVMWRLTSVASPKDFDFTAEVIMAGGPIAERNWQRLVEHTVAEWSGNLDATMATMTRNDPFQIMHATGLEVRGWDNVRAFYEQRMRTFQGQGFFAHRWVVSEKAVVGSGYFSGTPNGIFFGVPTTGKTLCLPMAIWIYFEDTLVKGEAAYLDGGELLKQIREGTTRQRNEPVF